MSVNLLLPQIATKPHKKAQKDGVEGGDNKGKKKRPRSDSQPAHKRPKLKAGDPGYDPYDFTSDEDEDPDESHDRGGKSGDIVAEEMDTQGAQQGGRVELGDKE